MHGSRLFPVGQKRVGHLLAEGCVTPRQQCKAADKDALEERGQQVGQSGPAVAILLIEVKTTQLLHFIVAQSVARRCQESHHRGHLIAARQFFDGRRQIRNDVGRTRKYLALSVAAEFFRQSGLPRQDLQSENNLNQYKYHPHQRPNKTEPGARYFDRQRTMRLVYLGGHGRQVISVRPVGVLEQTGVEQVVRFTRRKLFQLDGPKEIILDCPSAGFEWRHLFILIFDT